MKSKKCYFLCKQIFNKLKNMVGGAGAYITNERAPYGLHIPAGFLHESSRK